MKIETFDEARKFLSGIPHIDYGGCGVVAISMQRWLEKNEGENSGIILLYRPSKKDDGSFSRGPSHCGIEYKGTIIDRNEVLRLELYSNWMRISPGGMVNLLNNLNDWNQSFDRKSQVPVISEGLGIDLSDILISYPSLNDINN
jgi:hypothetical protein